LGTFSKFAKLLGIFAKFLGKFSKFFGRILKNIKFSIFGGIFSKFENFQNIWGTYSIFLCRFSTLLENFHIFWAFSKFFGHIFKIKKFSLACRTRWSAGHSGLKDPLGCRTRWPAAPDGLPDPLA
jgi:hypothetical protein